MKRLLLVLWLVVISVSANAQTRNVPSEFDFSAVPLNQVVSLYFKEVSKGPYVICNDVLTDTRPVSIRAGGQALDKAVIGLVLESFGYEARSEGGMTVVCKRAAASTHEDSIFVYRPLHRDASYLVDFLSPLVTDSAGELDLCGTFKFVPG